MENPYQPPAPGAPPMAGALRPAVEVVSRPTFVWLTFQQVYRFESLIADPEVLGARILDYYQRQNTRILSSSNNRFEFERLGTSVFCQLNPFNNRETKAPQTIRVTCERAEIGYRVTCQYRVRAIVPDILTPPHWLEEEVRGLAAECHGVPEAQVVPAPYTR